MKKWLFIFAVAFSGASHALDTTTPASAPAMPAAAPPVVESETVPADNWFIRNRSNSTALFWIGGSAHVDAPDGGKGTGYGGQADLRLKFGRCGIVADWHAQKISGDDSPDINNRIGGLGATCTILTFGKKTWGFRGAHIESSLLAEYGRTRYILYDHPTGNSSSRHEIGNGSMTGFGASAGVDFYFPLVWGLWTNFGLGYEAMDFHHDFSNVNGTASPVPNSLGYARLGFSYGI
jgi:hypothetical protein